MNHDASCAGYCRTALSFISPVGLGVKLAFGRFKEHYACVHIHWHTYIHTYARIITE